MRANYQSSYDAVAEEYAARIFDELRHKPFDRELLDRFAATVRDSGPACDMGCGPGQVARYLQSRGLDVCGYDLSPKMVELARQLNPGIEFHQGDMTALDVADNSLAGIVAFMLYSLAFVVQPIKSMAPIDQAFTKMLNDIILLIVGGIGGGMSKKGVQTLSENIAAKQTPIAPVTAVAPAPATSTWSPPAGSPLPQWINPALDEDWRPPPPPTTPPDYLHPEREEIAQERAAAEAS